MARGGFSFPTLRLTKATQGYVAIAVILAAIVALMALYRRDVRRCRGGLFEFANTDSQPAPWTPDIRDRAVERAWTYGKGCADSYNPEWKDRDPPPYSAEGCWFSAREKGYKGMVCLEGKNDKLYCVQAPSAPGVEPKVEGYNWRSSRGEVREKRGNLQADNEPCPNVMYGKHTKYNAANDTCCVPWSTEPQNCVHRGLCRERAAGRPHRGVAEHNRGYCCTKEDGWDCQTAKGPVVWPNCKDELKAQGYKFWGWGKTEGLCCKSASTQDRGMCKAPWEA